MVWAKNIKVTNTSQQGISREIVMDNVGNYYIAGYYTGSLDMDPGPGTYTLATYGGNSDIFIAKYRNNGTLAWAKSIGTSSDDAALDIVISPSQKVYVCGYYTTTTSIDVDPGPATYTLQGNGSNECSFIASYDTTGMFQSAFSIPNSHTHAIVVDNSENIYVTGDYLGTVDFDPGSGVYTKTSVLSSPYYCWNIFYAKYSSTSAFQWVNVKGSSVAPSYSSMMYTEYGASIDVDNITGNVVIGGAYSYKPYTEIASSTGTVLKSFSFTNSTSTSGGAVTGALFDNSGNLYYSGTYMNVNDFNWSSTATYTLPTSSYKQGFVVKYDPSLNFSWGRQMPPSMISNANLEMSFDNNQDLLLVGIEQSSNTSILMAKMDRNNASIIWRNNMTGSCYNGSGDNHGYGIVYSPVDGNVLVTGTIGGSSVGSSTPCSFDADPGAGVFTLNTGAGNTANREIFMGKYGSCTGAPTGLLAISGNTLQCTGANATYSISPVSGANSYTWSLPGGWTGTSTTNTISATASSSGTITVAAINSCGSSTLQSLSIQVNPVPAQPSVISGAASLCVGAASQTYSVPVVSGASSYSWSLPGSWSGTSTTNTIQISPGVSGGILSVAAVNSCGNGTSQSLSVTVNALPSVAITGVSSVCAGNSITLTSTGATTYTWSTSSNSNSISVSPTVNTTYSVAGKDANGCTNISTKNITVNNLPSIVITGASSLCAGSSIPLTASGAITYTWNTSSNSNNISVSPTANINYSVTGKDANGCTNIATKNITVNALPSVTITGVSSLCAGSSISLTASGASTYTWNTTSTSNSISVSPSGNTTYTVTGTDANGCTNIATKSITVNALPFVVIGGNTSICAGTNATLTATGATSYTWDIGATTNSISVSPSSGTTYSVIGTDANGCLGTAGANVAVSATLPIIVNGPSLLCSGSSATLDATGANTYTWSTGANTSSVSVSPTAFTIYTVTGTAINGCTGTAYKNITVVGNPTVSVTGPSSVCAGNGVTLSAAGAANYVWNTSATTNSISVSPVTSTTYSVLGIDANGCSGMALQNITVNALPSLSVSGPTLLCMGSSATIQAGGALSYTWSTGSNASSQVVSPFADITYTVYGTDANGCENVATKSITVSALPMVSVTGPSSVCLGSTISLTANGAATYTWNTGSNNSTISISPTANATYTLTGASVNNCTNTAVKSVTVSNLPLVTISGPTVVCKGNTSVLTASGASTYTWSTSSNTSSISVSPVSTTSYTVNGTGINGCSKEAVVTLSVSPCTGIEILNNKEASISLYPNPAKDEVYIQSNIAINAFSIIDITGRVIFETSGLNTEKATINLQEYNSGMYMILIYTSNSTSKLKFLKE